MPGSWHNTYPSGKSSVTADPLILRWPDLNLATFINPKCTTLEREGWPSVYRKAIQFSQMIFDCGMVPKSLDFLDPLCCYCGYQFDYVIGQIDSKVTLASSLMKLELWFHLNTCASNKYSYNIDNLNNWYILHFVSTVFFTIIKFILIYQPNSKKLVVEVD